MHILLIEDDMMIGRSLVRTLVDSGMTVEWVRDGIAGADAMTNGEHGLVLLDLGLPARDGIDLLDGAGRQGIACPLIVITARDDLDSRVLALDLGADDYLLKPFDGRELVARIRAVTRRHTGQLREKFVCGRLTLDLATHEVTHDGVRAILPPMEFALMRALTERPGTILSRSDLEVRLYGAGEAREGNAIDVLIHYVRKRFGKSVIHNVRGAGWMVLKER